MSPSANDSSIYELDHVNVAVRHGSTTVMVNVVEIEVEVEADVATTVTVCAPT
jgi:hypothetical protein